MNRSTIVVVALTLFAAGAAIAQPTKPNIIHIMVDDAGLGDLTSFSADSPVHTPNLDTLAQQGMRFTQAYCGAANCAPSRSALMTGCHLGHAYVRVNSGCVAIRDVDVTIAEVLRAAGYATGGYGKWGLGAPGSSGAPERQGFDEFVGYYDQVHAHSHFPDRLYDSGQTLLIPENSGFNEPETGLVSDTRVPAHNVIFNRMKAFVQRNCESKTPFYAWGAWTPPHRRSTLKQSEAAPGGVYDAYADKAGWDDFDRIQAGFITWIDRQVGELKQTLADPNGDGDGADSVLEQTLILFTSDNGGWESSHKWDRNIETRSGQTVDLRGAKEGYYEGGLRTPMIAHWPSKIAPGSHSALPVAFYDYMPTFAELAGLESALPPNVDGVSFAPTLTGLGAQKQRTGLYFEGYAYNPNAAPTQIARVGDWKMIRSGDGSVQLFDLATDPSEIASRAADPAAATVRDQLLGYITANHTPIQTQLSVLPPNIGTGNADRDGVMAFGLRPADQTREWRLVESGDTRSFVGLVRDQTNQTIAVHLDDLHRVYTAEITLEASAAVTSKVTVELVGESGFTYFRGEFDPTSLAVGAPTTVAIALSPAGLSPNPDELASDLGGSLALKVSHGGTRDSLSAQSIRLRGAAPTLTPPQLPGDLTGDVLTKAADWFNFSG